MILKSRPKELGLVEFRLTEFTCNDQLEARRSKSLCNCIGEIEEWMGSTQYDPSSGKYIPKYRAKIFKPKTRGHF